MQPRTRASAGPRYLELDRKELRIRGDQADDLTALTRQLNRARKGAGERITDNTLFRVAIQERIRARIENGDLTPLESNFEFGTHGDPRSNERYDALLADSYTSTSLD